MRFFRNADSIVIEVDAEKAIVKKTLALAKKYGKAVYGLVCPDMVIICPAALGIF